MLPLMVALEMDFDRAFGGLELRPAVEHGRTEFDDRGIHRVELVLEARLLFWRIHLSLSQHLMEDSFDQGPRTVGIGVRQGLASGRLA